MNVTASFWINQLHMVPHPEGGHYALSYRSDCILPHDALPHHQGSRAACTCIYFLLQEGEISALHRIASDEIWHFYAGGGLQVYEIKPEGQLNIHTLGAYPDLQMVFQSWVPAKSWFGAKVPIGMGYALVGCTVSPGFDFADFEMGDRHSLISQFPQHQEIIEKLTYDANRAR
jgi:predicted cupin superfamily sugar epimerase